MRSHGNTPHSPIDLSSPQVGVTPSQEMKVGPSRRQVIEVDQMSASPRLREFQQASQMLAHILEIREMRIVALRRDIESGHYTIKAEQVAEKIMKDYLLELCSS